MEIPIGNGDVRRAGRMKKEKPISRVMPRCLLCGFLSKQAVDWVVLKSFVKLVLPLSMCPSTPTLKFRTPEEFVGCIVDI